VFFFFWHFKFSDGAEVAIIHKNIKPNLAINDKWIFLSILSIISYYWLTTGIYSRILAIIFFGHWPRSRHH
jgi:hypothetical protein